MLDCPKCGATAYDGSDCTACKFSVGKPKQDAAPAADPLHLICQYVWEGQRCAELGTLSEGLRGQGPWYCHKHFPPFAGRTYGRKPVGPPAGFKSLKELLRKADPEAIAEREAIQAE